MPTLHANGIDIDYAVHGPADGTPLVLLRGLSTQRIQWPENFLEFFVSRGYRLVTPDNRDAGLTTAFDAHPAKDMSEVVAAAVRGEPLDAAYTLDDMAGDVIGLLDALEIETAHLAGMSMGGMIVQTVAARHGERLRSMCSIMSTSGAPGLPGPTPEAAQALVSPPPSLAREDVISHAMKTQRVIASPGFPPSDEELRHYFESAYDRSYRPAGSQRQMLAVMASPPRLELLAGIRVPTLVIHGSDDPLIPLACGRDTADRIPGAKFEVIAGMGHDLVSGNAPLVAAALDAHIRAVEAH